MDTELILLFTGHCFVLAVLHKTACVSHDKQQKGEMRKPQTILSRLNIYLQCYHAGDLSCILCQVLLTLTLFTLHVRILVVFYFIWARPLLYPRTVAFSVFTHVVHSKHSSFWLQRVKDLFKTWLRWENILDSCMCCPHGFTSSLSSLWSINKAYVVLLAQPGSQHLLILTKG